MPAKNRLASAQRWIVTALTLIIAFISSFCIAHYFQVQPEPLVRIIIFFLITFSLWKVKQAAPFKTCEVICLALFSILLAFSLVLGYHIVIENGNGYRNLMTESYISPYDISDLCALIFMVPGLYTLLATAFLFVKYSNPANFPFLFDDKAQRVISPKSLLIIAALLFAACLPYLLLYWPGFLFADSLSSLNQALGFEAFSNHHPFIYTLFIKGCLEVGFIFGLDATGGCALYSIIQMTFLSLCFSYLINWVISRCHLKKEWLLILAAVFGFTPYIATYSVAMWKDPLFSAALVTLSLLLMDFILTKGSVVKESKTWLPFYALMLIIVVFTRNNGVFIVAFLCVTTLLMGVFFRRKGSFAGLRSASATSIIILAVFLAITGPLYNIMGVAATEKVESFGVLLNQMARVAAYEGDMSEADQSYMDSLLPLELYPSTYRPCSIDLLKWDPHFNSEALNDGFFSHWVSMLLRNPLVYFEAWELETCGFWTINQPTINERVSNISGGVPVNTTSHFSDEFARIGIHPENKLGSDGLRSIFAQDESSIPIGFITWGLLFLTLCIVLLDKKSWLVALIPSLCLTATVVLASPLWYSPRYAAAEQFLVPFYLALFILLARSQQSGKEQP